MQGRSIVAPLAAVKYPAGVLAIAQWRPSVRTERGWLVVKAFA
jgi:hypothetical protein